MCRGAVSIDTLVEVPPDYNADHQNEVTIPAQQWYSSSKVRKTNVFLLNLMNVIFICDCNLKFLYATYVVVTCEA